MHVTRRIAPLILCILAVAAVPARHPSRSPAAPARRAAPTRPAALEQRIRDIVAKTHGVWGVSVRHVERHESAGIRENERSNMASVFKVPILVELFHQASEGKIALDERVEWKDPGRYFGSGVLQAMRPGLNPTIHDLATLMIIVSDNAATDQLLAHVGKTNVNARPASPGPYQDLGRRRHARTHAGGVRPPRPEVQGLHARGRRGVRLPNA